MADTVDIDVLHAAIVAGIRQQYPDFKTVEFYREDEEQRFPTPAVALEMTEVEPADLSECTGLPYIPFNLRFEARVILPRRSPTVKIDVRRRTLSLAAWLSRRRWPNCPGDEALVISVIPDEFSQNAEHFEVWVIEWQQLHFVAVDGRDDDLDVYGEPLYSFVPKIGIPHEPDYQFADGKPRE